MLSRFQTVLFDWDGTLCDSGEVLYRAFVKSLADFGLTFSKADYTAVYTPAWYRMYEAFGLPREEWKRCDQRWLVHYDGSEPGLLPGALETLEHCRTAALRVGIVTGADRARIEREFARLGLSFDAIVCHEDVKRKKPDPEGIFRALEILKTPAETACFVGDAPEDIEMGKRAGVFTIGVVSEYVDRGRIEAARPDLLVETIGELRSPNT